MSLIRFSIASTVAVFASALASSAQLEDLGSRPNQSAEAQFISDDGNVVAGFAFGGQSIVRHAFRHTGTDGYQLLDTLGETFVGVEGMSADGAFVIGNLNDLMAVRWASDGSATLLDQPGAPRNRCRDISADGSTVVGILDETAAASSELHAFRWTESTGIVDLHPSFPASGSGLNAVNGDGTVLVGYAVVPSTTHGTRQTATVWTPSTGVIELNPDDKIASSAIGVSRDGQVVAGSMWPIGTQERWPFVWTQAGGVLPIPTAGEPGPFTVNVSADGSTVFGRSGASEELVSYRWTAATGTQLLDSSVPFRALAASHDGQTIAGALVPEGQATVPAYWTAAGGPQPLPLPAMSTGGSVRALSADGWAMAGSSGRPGFLTRASRWRLDGTIGASQICSPAASNSVSLRGARITMTGSNVASDGALGLRATDLPPNTVGYFITSRRDARIVGAGGSQGTLCLGGKIGRFVLAGQILDSGPTGSFSLSVDPQRFPSTNGLVDSFFGETRQFQAWYRDANPDATSNFTDAVKVSIY